MREHGADLALGFDGDGDRCGVVDDAGEEIFADKIGLILARDLAPRYPNARFVVDVESTGLFHHRPGAGRRGCSEGLTTVVIPESAAGLIRIRFHRRR